MMFFSSYFSQYIFTIYFLLSWGESRRRRSALLSLLRTPAPGLTESTAETTDTWQLPETATRWSTSDQTPGTAVNLPAHCLILSLKWKFSSEMLESLEMSKSKTVNECICVFKDFFLLQYDWESLKINVMLYILFPESEECSSCRLQSSCLLTNQTGN